MASNRSRINGELTNLMKYYRVFVLFVDVLPALKDEDS